MGLWNLPHPVWQLLFATPYAFVVWQQSDLIATFFIWGLTAAAITTPADGQVDEWYSDWIPWPGTMIHDLIGLGASGLLITLPAGLSLVVLNPHNQEWVTTGLLVASSGFLKPFAYLPRFVIPDSLLKDKLWVCEPLAGAFLSSSTTGRE